MRTLAAVAGLLAVPFFATLSWEAIRSGFRDRGQPDALPWWLLTIAATTSAACALGGLALLSWGSS